jgi:hypothetical protein
VAIAPGAALAKADAIESVFVVFVVRIARQ